MATSYIPWAFARGTAIAEVDAGPGGIYARLEEAATSWAVSPRTWVLECRLARKPKALRLSGGVPVLTLVRVAYDVDGVPVEVCDTVMSSAHYVLSYELPAN